MNWKISANKNFINFIIIITLQLRQSNGQIANYTRKLSPVHLDEMRLFASLQRNNTKLWTMKMMWFQQMKWTSVIWSIDELTKYLFFAYETRIVFSVIQFSLCLLLFLRDWMFITNQNQRWAGTEQWKRNFQSWNYHIKYKIDSIKIQLYQYKQQIESNLFSFIFTTLFYFIFSIWENINIILCYIYTIYSTHIKFLFYHYFSTSTVFGI